MNKVLEFIKVFQSPTNDILFREVACYWFAKILHERFEYSSIFYNPHTVHFATKIDNVLYDISGIIEDEDDEYYDFEIYCTEFPEHGIELLRDNCINLKGGE